MNSTSILEQFIVKGKETQWHGWVLSTIIVIITAIVVTAVAVFAFASPSGTGTGGISSVGMAQNPELMAAQRYAADVAARGETLFEVVNPELNLVYRYKEAFAEAGMTQYDNPELMVAQRFSPNWVENPELNLVERYAGLNEEVSIYANPELRFVEGSSIQTAAGPELTIEEKYAVMGIEVSQPASVYANPELNLVSRFAASSVPALSENPELMVAQRFEKGFWSIPELSIEEKYAVMGIEVSQPASIYANPELNLVSRFPASSVPALSENPELMVARRFEKGFWSIPELSIEEKYAVMGIEVSQPVDYYENPELFLAGKITPVSEPVSLYENPELTLAQRFAAELEAGSTEWVQNPEVLFADKFNQPIVDSQFLSENPELKVHLQFTNGG